MLLFTYSEISSVKAVDKSVTEIALALADTVQLSIQTVSALVRH